MVAFAVGGLMGDTLFHLLPEIFLGEDSPDHARFVLVEPNRNLLLGLAIMVGFMTFVAMDKGLRIATGGAGHDHGHGHGHSHEGHAHGVETDSSKAQSSSVEVSGAEPKSRKKGKGSTAESSEQPNSSGGDEKELNPSVKLGGYLNLM